MTAPTIQTDLTGLARQTLDAAAPDCGRALHLLDAGGQVVYDLYLHSRAFCAECVSMIDTMLWAFPEASGWRVVDVSSGECVMAGASGEVA